MGAEPENILTVKTDDVGFSYFIIYNLVVIAIGIFVIFKTNNNILNNVSHLYIYVIMLLVFLAISLSQAHEFVYLKEVQKYYFDDKENV